MLPAQILAACLLAAECVVIWRCRTPLLFRWCILAPLCGTLTFWFAGNWIIHTGWMSGAITVMQVAMALEAVAWATFPLIQPRRDVLTWAALVAAALVLVGMLTGLPRYAGFPNGSAAWIVLRGLFLFALTGLTWAYLLISPVPQIAHLRKHCGWMALWFGASFAGDMLAPRMVGSWWPTYVVRGGHIAACCGWLSLTRRHRVSLGS